MKALLTFLAFTTLAWTQPIITAVQDGAAYTNNVAQGSVFVVKGTGLSATGNVSAPLPLPATLNNVGITFTPAAGGAAINARLIYTYNIGSVNQLAALLPSSTATGLYEVRVQNGATSSAPFRTSVVATKPGIVTANAGGTGPAQATLEGKLILVRSTNQGKIGDFDTRSAKPGDRVDLWGTGLGPDLASDTGGTSGNQTAASSIRVLVDGFEVMPIYAGRSQGSPGLDQIVFTLPAETALNCTVDVQIRAAGILSNAVTIATSNTDTCLTSPSIRINEVESNGGTPGDWVELFNPGTEPVDLTGYIFRDNDNTHNYKIPAVTVAPGAYYLLEEADFGFGLGSPDQARLFRPDGTLAASYSWTPHAATTYGRCPNSTGAFTTTNSSTKGAANDCGVSVKINEVESDGGTPGDWVELYNAGATPVDLSGFVFKDNDDTHTYSIPAGTSIAPGAYLVLDEAQFNFGLGSADSARLFDPAGVVVDAYTWTAHASTTYGRCPNGSGAFTTTAASTKGAANACAGDVTFATWPGGKEVKVVDNLNVFGGNLSGLIYEGSGSSAPGVLWGARNGPGTLFRLIFDGTNWVPDSANGWSAGRPLRYMNGNGDPDAEGVTFAGDTAAAGIYISTERDNSNNSVSRNSILRFDPTSSGGTLTATHEWNLTADLPTTGANLGMEGITWVPDSFLVASKFFDESKNRVYNPADYPNHGAGIFFIGIEANGMVYAYALDHSAGTFTRLATIATGLAGVMDVQFDRGSNDLWAVCDDTCQGRTVVLRPDSAGRMTVARRFERPADMPNLNNEGFAMAPASQCVGNVKPVFWADDSETGGYALRAGTLSCLPF